MDHELLGYFAASLVFATFCTRRMVPLRVTAISSNMAFLAYGCLGHLWPIVALHALLLPVNCARLRGACAASAASVSTPAIFRTSAWRPH
ncbi:MAG TPA: hypothetical protein VFA12_18705 [Stellaceae bacterium]|nr:hypothetical protein [Stellaceae bacterium]